MLNSILHFLIRSRIFISLASIGLLIESSIFTRSFLPSFVCISFLFFSTLFAYNLYYIKTKYFPYSMPFAMTSFILALIFFAFCLKEINLFVLFIGCTLSIIYLIPVLLNLNPSPYFSFVKLLIITIVWTMTTSLLQKNHSGIDSFQMAFITYRFLLMLTLCSLFFIKDEHKPSFNYIGNLIFKLSLTAQILVAFFLLYLSDSNQNACLGILYLAISTLIIFTFGRLQLEKKNNDWYLLKIDGIMILQSTFAILIHLIN